MTRRHHPLYTQPFDYGKKLFICWARTDRCHVCKTSHIMVTWLIESMSLRSILCICFVLYKNWKYSITPLMTGPPGCPRLLHSPSLVVIGLSLGYETWPPIRWYPPFVIDWSMNICWDWLHCNGWWACDWWEFAPFFVRPSWQSPCTALMAGNLPAIRAVQGDCGRVYCCHPTWIKKVSISCGWSSWVTKPGS